MITHDHPFIALSGNFKCYAASICSSLCLLPDAEIVEFCRFLEPTPAEAAMREAATQRVRQAIVDVFPTASVQVFGSYVTGRPVVSACCPPLIKSPPTVLGLQSRAQPLHS